MAIKDLHNCPPFAKCEKCFSSFQKYVLFCVSKSNIYTNFYFTYDIDTSQCVVFPSSVSTVLRSDFGGIRLGMEPMAPTSNADMQNFLLVSM